MSDTVDIVLAHPYKDHNAGSRISVSAEEGQRIVGDYVGRYATAENAPVAENASAEVDADEPAHVHAAKKK